MSEALDSHPDFFPSAILEPSINPSDVLHGVAFSVEALGSVLAKYLFTAKVLLTHCPGEEPVTVDIEVLV